jgi:hypothetical protein
MGLWSPWPALLFSVAAKVLQYMHIIELLVGGIARSPVRPDWAKFLWAHFIQRNIAQIIWANFFSKNVWSH